MNAPQDRIGHPIHPAQAWSEFDIRAITGAAAEVHHA